MKVSPANVVLTIILLLACIDVVVVVHRQYLNPPVYLSPTTPSLQKAQSLRMPTSTTVPSPTMPLPVAQATPILIVVSAPTLNPPILTTLDQYRAWMVEARLQYPYDESLDTMWSVMLCESSGNADVVADMYYGLFQYNPITWAGDWNPYRELPILDPHAQIFATAKAWYEGNQNWWGCYPA